MNNKPLNLFVGPSGSGKTTIANEFEKYGYKQVKSYTTRAPRCQEEDNHIFISDEEFDKLENIIAYTEYSGHRYCATKEQIDDSDIYVIDIDGVNVLLEKYDNLKRTIHIWYFESHINTRISRMINRGDADMTIVGRVLNDESYDWYDKLSVLIEYHQYFGDGKNVKLHIVNANSPVNEIIVDELCFLK